MIDLDIDVSGALARIRATERRMDRRIADALVELAPSIVRQLRALTPRSTGQLARSWSSERTAKGVIFRNSARYAAFVRGGTLKDQAERVVREQLRAHARDLADALTEAP